MISQLGMQYINMTGEGHLKVKVIWRSRSKLCLYVAVTVIYYV